VKSLRTASTIAWEAYRAEFPIFERTTYFNSCSLGALSTRVAGAVHRFTELWDTSGAAAWHAPWPHEIERLRERFAGLIGATTDEVALFPSVTAALTAVASAFDYRARPKVVISDLEFPTTVYQWLVKDRDGVVLEMLRSPDRLSVPVDLYARATDERTQLLVASQVYFTSGMIQDIAALARIARERGAYTVIDAYQGIGQVPTDVHAAQVDVLVTGGLKWLLGGTGIAFLYVRGDLVPNLKPTIAGWFGNARMFDFDPRVFEFADTARRFELGTTANAAVYAASAGLDIILEIGVERLRSRTSELVTDLVDRLSDAGFLLKTPDAPEDRAGIVAVHLDDPAKAVKTLGARNFIVDYRHDRLRMSPYFYNSFEDNERVVDALRAVAPPPTT